MTKLAQLPLGELGPVTVYQNCSQLLRASACCLCMWLMEPELWQPRPGGGGDKIHLAFILVFLLSVTPCSPGQLLKRKAPVERGIRDSLRSLPG